MKFPSNRLILLQLNFSQTVLVSVVNQALNKFCHFETTPTKQLSGIGENIRLTIVDEQTHLPSGAEITEIWTREAKDFDFEKPGWNPSEFVDFQSLLNFIKEYFTASKKSFSSVFHISIGFRWL